MKLHRPTMLKRLREEGEWDVCIIGGGATGLGIALEAAASGLRTALIEGRDFASGTSSRSTKLVHGGVRYLEQGKMALVSEALKERDRMMVNAGGHVEDCGFLIPVKRRWAQFYYGIGLKLYDLLAGRHRWAVDVHVALPPQNLGRQHRHRPGNTHRPSPCQGYGFDQCLWKVQHRLLHAEGATALYVLHGEPPVAKTQAAQQP